MNKKLLAASIAAAVAAPSVYADAVVYGKLHTSVDAIDYESTDEDTYKMQSRASRLGFKGSEDLGGGLKAIYQIEMQFNSDGGDDQDVGDFTAQRNTFVGLSGDWGTFLVGRHDTPAKMAFYAAGNERLGDSVIDLNGSPIGVFREFRANNAIAYVSPNFSGFTLAAAIIPGEQAGESTTTPTWALTTPTGTSFSTTTVTSANDNDGLADHWSVGLMYSGNGLKAGVGYEKLASLTNSGSEVDYKMWQAGASYTMNNFSIGAQYEDGSDYLFVDDTDYTAWAVTGKATFGNNAISLVYTDSEIEPDSSGEDIETSGWGVSAEHNFSKRTKVYVAYADNETEYETSSIDDHDDDVFSLGIIHDF